MITIVALANTSSKKKKKTHLIIYFSLMSPSRDSTELSEDLGSFYLGAPLGFALSSWTQAHKYCIPAQGKEKGKMKGTSR